VTEMTAPINQTVCQIAEVNYSLVSAPCDRCQQMVPYFATTERVAIDLHLDHPALLQVVVSVHYCGDCHHYFRAQPPFMRRDAIYTQRVVERAVQPATKMGWQSAGFPSGWAATSGCSSPARVVCGAGVGITARALTLPGAISFGSSGPSPVSSAYLSSGTAAAAAGYIRGRQLRGLISPSPLGSATPLRAFHQGTANQNALL